MWKLVLYCSFLYSFVCEEHNVTITRSEDGDVITADINVLKLDCSQIQGSKEHQQTSCKCEKNRSIFHEYPNQTYGCYHFQTFCKDCINIGFGTYIKGFQSVDVLHNRLLLRNSACSQQSRKIYRWKETFWNEIGNNLKLESKYGFSTIHLLGLQRNISLSGNLIRIEICQNEFFLKLEGNETLIFDFKPSWTTPKTLPENVTTQPSTAFSTSAAETIVPSLPTIGLPLTTIGPPLTTTITTTTTTKPITETIKITATTTTTSEPTDSTTTTINTPTTSTLLTTNKQNKTTGTIKDEKDNKIVEIVVPIVIFVLMVAAVKICILCRRKRNNNVSKDLNIKAKLPVTYDNESMDVEEPDYDGVVMNPINIKNNPANKPVYIETEPSYEASTNISPYHGKSDSSGKATNNNDADIMNPTYNTLEPTYYMSGEKLMRGNNDSSHQGTNDEINSVPSVMSHNHSHPHEEPHYFELEGTYDSAGAVLDTDEIIDSAAERIIEDEYAVVDKSLKTKYMP